MRIHPFAPIRECAAVVFAIVASSVLLAAEPNNLLKRIKIAESIFDVKFSSDRIERLLTKSVEVELVRLEKNEAAAESVSKIRKILNAVATDVVNSKAFKNQYSTWLADQLDEAELWRYYEFIRSDFGKKISDLDDRAQPLVGEAINRSNRGRLNSIPVLLAEAQSK